ncbi:MAG: hypothetical protein RBJ76_20665 [Stenomitos frigidus ULC029]
MSNKVLSGVATMFKAIATFGTVLMLTSFVSAAHAQEEPMGSAAALDGLEERSVIRPLTDTSVPLSPQRSTDVPGGRERGLQLNNAVQILVRPERGTSQVGVYPADDPSSGNKLQVLYRLD